MEEMENAKDHPSDAQGVEADAAEDAQQRVEAEAVFLAQGQGEEAEGRDEQAAKQVRQPPHGAGAVPAREGGPVQQHAGGGPGAQQQEERFALAGGLEKRHAPRPLKPRRFFFCA